MVSVAEIVVQLRMRNPSRGTNRPALIRNFTSSTQEGLPTTSSIPMPHPVYGPDAGIPPMQPMVEEIEMHPSSSTAH
jgi:hypothetical protein